MQIRDYFRLNEISNESFSNNEILEAHQLFSFKEITDKYSSLRIANIKWKIFHLFLASNYQDSQELLKELPTDKASDLLSLVDQRAIGDIRFCKVLSSFYLGFFQKTIQLFFEGNKNETIFDYHQEDNYQLGHDYLLVAKAYWKMGYFSRAHLYLFKSLHFFNQYDSRSIWIAKVIGLIGVIYYQEDNIEKGHFFSQLAIDKLEKELPDKFKNHHVYATICCDRAEGKILDAKRMKKGEEKDDILDDDIHSSLESARLIFETIYKGKPSRYNAMVYKTKCQFLREQAQSIEVKEQKSEYSDEAIEQKREHLDAAIEHLEDDIAIRKRVFERSQLNEKLLHHPTLGRSYNILSSLNLLKCDAILSNNEKESLLYENAHYANMTMHYVVKGFVYEKIDATIIKKNNLDWSILGMGITKKNVRRANLSKIQSYSVLLKALHLKLVIIDTLAIDKYSIEHLDKYFEDTMEIAIRFINEVREVYGDESTNYLANLRLNKVVRPLFEVILRYLHRLFSEEGREEKRRLLLEKIFIALESSKNYYLVQAVEQDEISISSDVFLIEELTSEFMDEKIDISEKFIFLQYQQDEIDRICDELYHRDGKKIKLKKIPTLKNIEDRLKGKTGEENETSSIQQTPFDKTQIISYFVGDENVFAFTINMEHSNFHKLEIQPSSLESEINRYVKMLDSKEIFFDDGFLEIKEAQKLYEQLIEPLSLPEEIKFLVIIPDKYLSSLPFDVIPTFTVGKQEKYLIHKYITSYHFSLSLLYKAIREGYSDSWQNNYVGISSNYKDAKDYPSAIESEQLDTNLLSNEVSTVWTRLSKINTDEKLSVKCYLDAIDEKLIDKEGVKDYSAFTQLKSDITTTQLLHFALHGNSNMTTLKLDKELEIGLKEIEKIKDVKLVILNGCHTGRRAMYRDIGTEIHNSLGRLFLMSKGVRNVMFSLTKVINTSKGDFEERVDLMELFIEKCSESLDIIENEKRSNIKYETFPVALAHAKRKILNLPKFNKFPQFASTLIFVGNPLDYFSI